LTHSKKVKISSFLIELEGNVTSEMLRVFLAPGFGDLFGAIGAVISPVALSSVLLLRLPKHKALKIEIVNQMALSATRR
jgi:hypothetical protein